MSIYPPIVERAIVWGFPVFAFAFFIYIFIKDNDDPVGELRSMGSQAAAETFSRETAILVAAVFGLVFVWIGLMVFDALFPQISALLKIGIFSIATYLLLFKRGLLFRAGSERPSED